MSPLSGPRSGPRPGSGTLLESAASLCALPTELVLAIIAELAPADLNALAQTNRGLYQTVNPLLYQQNVQKQGTSALTWACAHGRTNTLPHLRAQGADFNGVADAPPGWFGGLPSRASPMHLAAKHGRIDILRWLLDVAGADINARSIDFCACRPVAASLAAPTPRWTPLHTAVCHGHTDAAVFLLSRGACTVVSPRGGSNTSSPPSCSKALPSRHRRHAPVTDITVLHSAAAANNKRLLAHLLSHSLGRPNTVDSHGYTPLHYAAARAHSDAIIPSLRLCTAAWPAGRTRPPSPFTTALLAGAFGSARLLHMPGTAADPQRAQHWRDPSAAAADPRRVLGLVIAHTAPRPGWDSTTEEWVRQRERFVMHLLACGADPASAGALLHKLAAQPAGLTTPAVYEALLEAGAEADEPDGGGDKPLFLLAGQLRGLTARYPCKIPDEVYQPFAEKVALLQEYGANVLAPEGEEGKEGFKTLVRFMGLGEAKGKGKEWHVLPAWRRKLLGEVLRRAKEVELEWWGGWALERWARVFVENGKRGKKRRGEEKMEAEEKMGAEKKIGVEKKTGIDKKMGAEKKMGGDWMFLDGIVDESDWEENEDGFLSLVPDIRVAPLLWKLGDWLRK